MKNITDISLRVFGDNDCCNVTFNVYDVGFSDNSNNDTTIQFNFAQGGVQKIEFTGNLQMRDFVKCMKEFIRLFQSYMYGETIK